MSQKNMPVTSDFSLDSMGSMPTMKRQVMSNGMVIGVDQGAVWVWGKVPLAPIADARDTARMMDAFLPLHSVTSELAAMTPPAAIKRRSAMKNSYRQIQALRINVPQLWSANVRPSKRERAHGQRHLNEWLNRSMVGQVTKDSLLGLGVLLQPSVSGSGLKQMVDSVLYTLIEGGTALMDYDRDLEAVMRIFDRHGVTGLTGAEINSLDSFWNPGQNPDVPTLAHPDHIHVIRDSRTLRHIHALEEAGEDCEQWPLDYSTSATPTAPTGQSTVSFGTVSDIEVEFTSADDSYAHWAIPLLDSGALAISVRGALEPAKITREELRRNRRNYLNDIAEQQSTGHMSRGDQQEKVARLEQIETHVGSGVGDPTLVDASVLVAMDGRIRDFATVSRGAAVVQPMENRQSKAWAEMMITGMRKSNPNVLEFPTNVLAASGIQDASKSGDRSGILRGFSERNRLPVWHNPEEAYLVAEAAPMTAIIGASGSGKTMLMQWDAFQTDLLGYPQVLIDPKRSSDLTGVVSKMRNSKIYSLDQLARSNGVFDPFKYAHSVDVAVEQALANLADINPFGSAALMAQLEPDLLAALRHGAEAGHTSTMTALRRAAEDGLLDPAHLERIEKLSRSSALFGALVGSDDDTEGLNLHDGTTLIMAGETELNLPQPGAAPSNLNQRVNMTLVRNMVFGSSMALTGRRGVIRLDEAWVFTSSNPQELIKLARLARSQNTDVNLYTQQILDVTKTANLKNYITRGLILHLKDPVEAHAACEIFDLEPTPERMGRILATGTLDDDRGSPDYNSLKALKHPETGQLLRGSVGINIDIHGRAVPTEIVVPRRFLQLASTNADDIAERNKSETEPSEL